MTNQHALALESAGSSQQTMTTGNDLEIVFANIYFVCPKFCFGDCRARDEMTLQQYDKQIPKVKSH
jgi:hypothetical protein